MEEDQLKLIKDFQELISKDASTPVKAKDESEKFLLEYELECRKAEELDDHIKNAKKELFETKRFLKDTLRWKPSGKNQQQIENFERKLNSIKVKYGKLRKDNEILREQIQVIRRNTSGAHRELTTLTNSLHKINNKTRELQDFSYSNHEVSMAHKARMDKMNSSFTTTRMNMNDRVSKLEDIYRKESNSVTPTSFKRPRTPYSELAENMRALKFMSKKWTEKVREKERHIMEYRENIHELEEALDIMKNVVNTTVLNVAVKAFIDSCEQEKDLSSNFLRISEKIDNFERNIEKTRRMIHKVTEDTQSKESKKQNYLSKIDKEVEKINKEISKYSSIKAERELSIEKISQDVLSMIRNLESLGIKAQSFQLIEDPSLNSTNVIAHLNKLEELIEVLLAGLSIRKPPKYDAKEEKTEKKIQLNAIDIDDMPVDELLYPMTVEEIRAQARNFLNNAI